MKVGFTSLLLSPSLQFSKLTNNFEKLRLHQMKQNQSHRKEASNKDETPFELSSLNQKIEKQAQNYQTQLNGKQQRPEDSSPETPRLVCESSPGCEATQRDEFIIEKLKSAVSEIALSRNKLQDENQKLLQELKMYQRQCQAMEAGLSEVKNELQSRDDLLRIIEMERLHLHRELLKMGELQTVQDNRKRVESSYSPSTKEPERKRKELFSVVSDQPNHEKELNKMRSQLYQEEDLCSEQERMRNEISELTQELHQKEVTIATIMKKAALLERQLKIELEIKEKMLAKQQISDRRYKAVRTENTHLKGMMGDLDPARYLGEQSSQKTHRPAQMKGPCQPRSLDVENECPVSVHSVGVYFTPQTVDFSNKEHSRHTSINKLEYENERLRSDLAKLHINGKAAWSNQSSYEGAGAYIYQSQLKTETGGDRISEDCEMNRSPTPLSPLPFQTKEMTSPLAGDNEVLPLSPPDISFRASLAAQHFLMEEEKRAKELEKLLNTHIDELQRHTEFTLNKYTKLKQSRHI